MDRSIDEVLSPHGPCARSSAPALLAPGMRALSYGELVEQVAACRAELDRVLPDPAARVAVAARPGATLVAACVSTLACRPLIPLDADTPQALLVEQLRATRARLVITDAAGDGPRAAAAALGLPVLRLEPTPHGGAGAFRLIDDGDPRVARVAAAAIARAAASDRLAVVFQTSGTTGTPKVVPLTLANVDYVARSVAKVLALGPADRCLTMRPPLHSGPLIVPVLGTLVSGGAIVCVPTFDRATFFERLREFEPTWYSAVPAIHEAVLAAGDAYRRDAPDHRFRFVHSGAAPMSPSTMAGLEALFAVPAIEFYGLTETSATIAANRLPPGLRKPGSAGLPCDGSEVAVLDESGHRLAAGETGEVALRGPGVMAGYEGVDGDDPTLVDGWLRTGDLGHVDADGYLFITGRSKEMINKGGAKVSPRLVDDALLALPDVVQAVAYAVPHPTLGQDVAAAVVLREGATRDARTIRAMLATRLAAHEMPSRLTFVDSIPRTATGKPRRLAMHALLGAAQVPDSRAAPERELSPTEREIARVWCDVLRLPSVGVGDNFFDLGGDSLRARQAAEALARRFGRDLAGVRISDRTLEQVAADVDATPQTVRRGWWRRRSA